MTDLQYISLEQWRTLVTVVDTGGYAQAATALHKSQSAVTYAVQKLESLLDVKAFEMQGRKAILTPTGQFLYRRAKALLDESSAIERAAKRLSAGWEAEIRLAAEIIFPTWLLLDCLNAFGKESPHTRVELIESVISGTTEALLGGKADFAIAALVPPGFLGTPLMQLRFVPVAHPAHPLHQLNRTLTVQDLRAHRHLVIRESGVSRAQQTSIETTQRWTVSNSATSLQAVLSGYGFAWFPVESIRNELSDGSLKQLPIDGGGERLVQLYMVIADPDSAGPGVRRLTEIIREAVSSACKKFGKQESAMPMHNKEDKTC